MGVKGLAGFVGSRQVAPCNLLSLAKNQCLQANPGSGVSASVVAGIGSRPPGVEGFRLNRLGL